MECSLCSWEVLALLGFVILLKFIRSLMKVKRITERHVFISGCGSGFGRLLAESLDRKGVHVYAGCRRDSSVKELKEKCSSRMKPLRVDVADTASVQKAAEYVKNQLGGKALWAIVNNAGIFGVGGAFPFEWTRKEDCQKVLETNLLGAYDVTLAFLPLIKRGREGRIVNMSSIHGKLGLMIGGYPLSKYGLEAMSDGLSYELCPFNITVHTLQPGLFSTNIMTDGLSGETLRRRWSELDEETRQRYGGEEYLEKICTITKKFILANASPKVELVTEAYERALFDRYPKNRYVVGNDAKYFYTPLSWLPFEYQMMVLNFLWRLSGIDRPMPKDVVK